MLIDWSLTLFFVDKLWFFNHVSIIKFRSILIFNCPALINRREGREVNLQELWRPRRGHKEEQVGPNKTITSPIQKCYTGRICLMRAKVDPRCWRSGGANSQHKYGQVLKMINMKNICRAFQWQITSRCSHAAIISVDITRNILKTKQVFFCAALGGNSDRL